MGGTRFLSPSQMQILGNCQHSSFAEQGILSDLLLLWWDIAIVGVGSLVYYHKWHSGDLCWSEQRWVNSSIGQGDKAEEWEHNGYNLKQTINCAMSPMLPLWAVSALSGQITGHTWQRQPHLLPKSDNKLLKSAPRHHSLQCCEAKAALCEEGQKRKHLTSQMRDGSDEEHCQTSPSVRNPGNGSPDSAALGDQAETWRSCYRGFLNVASLSGEVIWGWASLWPTLVELKQKNIYTYCLNRGFLWISA